jgi:phosphoribosylformylglycinamidine synthase
MKTYRLNVSELEKIYELLNRDIALQDLHPVEWSVFSALWSEHCSYKSSKVHLKKFGKTLTSKVVSPEGENAGILDLGQGEKVVFKMESHNHPSFIEPYQGAATGVGGILRDIFTMGARPIASANFLCFGESFTGPQKRMGALVDGVVRGIAGYGNAVGVPTVTGQTNFDSGFKNNILVNAMSVGLLNPEDPIALSGAKGIGNWVVYVGAKTGRDGIHGASMASESFTDDNSAKRPNVQIGDPFFEKLLIESCLEVLKKNLVVSIQDMGAAGLTSSSFEMAEKGKVGMRLDLKKVPVRDSSMKPDEILLSESQERMLMIIEPQKFPELKSVFEHWGLDAAVIGEVTEGPEIEIQWNSESVARINPAVVVSQAPMYQRPYTQIHATKISIESGPKPESSNQLEAWLKAESASVHQCAKTSIYKQFDQRVGAKTVRGANYDVAVLRLPRSARALALTVGCRPWIMRQDAVLGGFDSVFYQALQMSIKGFKPQGLTDCLNFGNPENPQIMSEFVASVEAIAQSSILLDAPVISGNVSFYNETLGESIPSTPAVGMVGLKDSSYQIPEDRFLAAGLQVMTVDLALDCEHPEKLAKILPLLQKVSVQDSFGVQATQMVGRGGLALSLLKCSRRGFGFEADRDWLKKIRLEDLWREKFYQAIFAVKPDSVEAFEQEFKQAGLKTERIGHSTSNRDARFVLNGLCDISVSEWIQTDQISLRSQIENLA